MPYNKEALACKQRALKKLHPQYTSGESSDQEECTFQHISVPLAAILTRLSSRHRG